jgi:hypothetical protein
MRWFWLFGLLIIRQRPNCAQINCQKTEKSRGLYHPELVTRAPHQKNMGRSLPSSLTCCHKLPQRPLN